jgi:hypothetical protein
MSFTAEQIQENWDQLLQTISINIPSRSQELLKFYTEYENRIALAPASAIEHYHNAFAGGYVDHINRVHKCALTLYTTWQSMGANMTGYTLEELSFAAINHDLGKIGDVENTYYELNDSDWHVKNQGKIYDYNKSIVTMEVPHRGLWMLQNSGIKVTQNEYIAIMVHDGMYVEGNWYYYKGANERAFRNNMPLILHQADLMASRIEFEQWKSLQSEIPHQTTKVKKTTPTVSPANESAITAFKELFG